MENKAYRVETNPPFTGLQGGKYDLHIKTNNEDISH